YRSFLLCHPRYGQLAGKWLDADLFKAAVHTGLGGRGAFSDRLHPDWLLLRRRNRGTFGRLLDAPLTKGKVVHHRRRLFTGSALSVSARIYVNLWSSHWGNDRFWLRTGI